MAFQWEAGVCCRGKVPCLNQLKNSQIPPPHSRKSGKCAHACLLHSPVPVNPAVTYLSIRRETDYCGPQCNILGFLLFICLLSVPIDCVIQQIYALLATVL